MHILAQFRNFSSLSPSTHFESYLVELSRISRLTTKDFSAIIIASLNLYTIAQVIQESIYYPEMSGVSG